MQCRQCKVDKDSSQFVSTNSKSGLQKVTVCCGDCRNKRRDYYHNNLEYFNRVNKVYRHIHKDALLSRNRLYNQNNKDKTSRWYFERDMKLKDQFLQMYGGICQCCGEREVVFLCLDHINGQVGKKKKEASSTAYRRAIKSYNPKEFRILCHNCNSAVRFGRICPHQRRQDELLSSDTNI